MTNFVESAQALYINYFDSPTNYYIFYSAKFLGISADKKSFVPYNDNRADEFQSYYGVHWMANSVHHTDLNREIAGSSAYGYGSIGEYIAYSQYERDFEHIVDVDDDDDTEANDARYVRRRVRGRRYDSYHRKRDVGAGTIRSEHPRVAGARESRGTRGIYLAKLSIIFTKC